MFARHQFTLGLPLRVTVLGAAIAGASNDAAIIVAGPMFGMFTPVFLARSNRWIDTDARSRQGQP
eukprot:4522552-Pyramimonas_sp.AAC.1